MSANSFHRKRSSWLTVEISKASKGPRGDWIQVPITSENERVLLDEKNSEPHDGDQRKTKKTKDPRDL
mgnify:CR=1 FL=1